jgi:hypothetical protein
MSAPRRTSAPLCRLRQRAHGSVGSMVSQRVEAQRECGLRCPSPKPHETPPRRLVFRIPNASWPGLPRTRSRAAFSASVRHGSSSTMGSCSHDCALSIASITSFNDPASRAIGPTTLGMAFWPSILFAAAVHVTGAGHRARKKQPACARCRYNPCQSRLAGRAQRAAPPRRLSYRRSKRRFLGF